MRWDMGSLIPSQIKKLSEGEAVLKYNGFFYYFDYFTLDCPRFVTFKV